MQTRMQASKVVAKNGCVLGGSIMIGISRCKDSSVLDHLNTSTLQDTSVNNMSSGMTTPRTIRPLTQSYRDNQSGNQVVLNTDTPSKNNGLVSKAMEYVFGW